jgi:4-oxalocrotonate tautomerase
MPNINVEFIEGRTVEQKRNLASAMTDAVVEVLGVNREVVRIRFVDIKKHDVSRGGVLVADK